MADLILSTSSIGHYLDCPRRWYMKNVLRAREESTIAAVIGQATHAGVEALVAGKPEPERTLERSWVDEQGAMSADTILSEDIEVARQDAHKMLAAYSKKVAPTWHPTMIERKFLAMIAGITVSGIIDSADEKADEVRDLKTTAGKTINGRAPRFDHLRYRLQMSIYSCGYFALTGRWPQRMALDVVTRAGRYRQYEMTPDYGEMMTMISVVATGIKAAKFEPSGATSGRCGMCPFRNICEFSTAKEDRNVA